MEYNMNDALMMIGELHYEKRVQQHEIADLRTANAFLKTAHSELEAELEEKIAEISKLSKTKGRK